MTISYLGIGSNIGDRHKTITRAIEKIGRLKGTQVIKTSGIYRTSPVGGPKGQGFFLNAAVKVDTKLSVGELLREIKSLERSLGRKKAVRWGPRVIDVDILFFGDKQVRSKRLCVPHARVFVRDFVKGPLSEIIW